MGSALLDTFSLDPAVADASSDSPAAAAHNAAHSVASPAPSEALRRQLAERIAAHRKLRPSTQPAFAFTPAPSASARAARIAATVTQRYAQAPSYRAYLAAEAERASQQAQAAAQIAALNALAIAQAQQQLLASLEQAAFEQAALEQASLEQASLDLDPLHRTQNDSPPQLPHELALGPDAQHEPPDAAPARTRSATNAGAPSSASAASSPKAHQRAHSARANTQPFAPVLPGLTVRLFEDTAASTLRGTTHSPLASSLAASSNRDRTRHDAARNQAEARLLDEEIAFRQSPVFEEPCGPPTPLPANLIEFPRQLVASRKARPRYAEGPLRDVAVPAPGEGQLRIFEVDPSQISTTPAPAEAPAPQWTSIWLDAPIPNLVQSAPASSSLSSPGDDRLLPHSDYLLSSRTLNEVEAEGSSFSSTDPAPLPQIASISRRLTAAAIDTAVLLAGFLAFTATFLLAAGRSLQGSTDKALSIVALSPDRHSALARLSADAAAQFTAHTGLQPSLALAASALVLALFYLLYQALFFSLSESTPGMRCARIALCTFDDENPTRRAMRRRVLAVLVSVCPLGLGLLWATLDEDRLSWHDRLTRIYQRSY